MVQTFVPNSTSRKTILAVTEATRGAGGVPTYRWRGEIAINKDRPLVRDEEATGTRDPFVSPQQGLPTLDGTYNEVLTYPSLSQHMRYGLVAGDPAVADAAATIAYTRSHEAGDVLDSAYLQYGFPGFGDQSRGVIHNEWNIAWDFEDSDAAWKFSSTLLVGSKDALPGTLEGGVTTATATTLSDTTQAWTIDAYTGAWITIIGGTGYGQQRQVASNTATAATVTAPWDVVPDATSTYRIEGLFEAGIPSQQSVKIATPGTKVYIDPVGGTLGATQILNRMISGNINVQNQLAPKWFAENEDNPSDKMDEGYRVITGQFQFERDRRNEYRQMEDLDEVMIRFEKEGPVIDETAGTNYMARVDVARAVWESPSPGTRQNNYTVTFGFLAYVPLSLPILDVTTVTPVAALG